PGVGQRIRPIIPEGAPVHADERLLEAIGAAGWIAKPDRQRIIAQVKALAGITLVEGKSPPGAARPSARPEEDDSQQREQLQVGRPFPGLRPIGQNRLALAYRTEMAPAAKPLSDAKLMDQAVKTNTDATVARQRRQDHSLPQGCR